ncbi:MAG TPA: DEAD/DEAH box helicase [Vicinamibacteria bacterium]|nr:DEAD/DEAH box helicase [Vicinamibacteria bacterium]
MPFSSFDLDPLLLRGVRELGFTRPTPIQEQSIPPAVTGRDVLACAATGSGKTAAFGLPMLNRLMAKPRRTTRALILTPTRELCAQIDAHLQELAVHTPVTSAAVFGGVGMGPQEHAFRSGVDVIVATPGRLLDHFRHPYAALRGLEVLVLDEADRMLDMGFLPDIKRVLRHLPAKRQTLFFSATLPAPIVALAREMLQHPVTVNLDRQSVPPVGITQAAYPVDAKLKPALLLALLRRGDMESALVFTRTKHRANRLADWLARQGVRAARIHGNRSQSQRTQALEGFKAGRHDVLVATDIAARGIDVVALGHVVNFDVPAASDDYIHRVGRTGRAEATGEAFTFVAPEDEPALRAIERAIGKPLPRVLLPDFDYRQRPPEAPQAPPRHAPRAPRLPRPAPSAGRGHSGPRRRSVPDGGWAGRLQAEVGHGRTPARSFRPRRRPR